MIPRAAVPLVRECAHEGIPMVSDAVERNVDLHECSRKLIALSDLLDLIGWSEDEEPTGDVDATEHSNTLTEVAPSLIATLTTEVKEAKGGDKAKTEKELGFLTEIHTHARELLGGDPPPPEASFD